MPPRAPYNCTMIDAVYDLIMTSPLNIGHRRSYNGDLCTIRYVGPVSGTAGEWLGVEWDDPTRGKHSGEHNGVRYFTCNLLWSNVFMDMHLSSDVT